MSVRRAARRGGLLLLGVVLLAAGSLSTAPVAAAGTPPGSPGAVQLTLSATSIVARWSIPFDGPAVSAVVVTRTGLSADGEVSLTRTLAPTTWAATFDGLIPGGRYTISVALTNRSGTGPAAMQRATLSSAGLPTLVDQTPVVSTAGVVSARSWDDIPCALYHFNPAVCGRAGTTFRTTGYTAATASATWLLSVNTTREFGCLRHGTTEYRARTTLSRRVEVNQYGYWEYEPVRIGVDGTSTNGSAHLFTNPRSYSPTDDMPHYVCPVGWDIAQASATVSRGVALLVQGSVEVHGPILGVLYLPGTASSTADWATA